MSCLLFVSVFKFMFLISNSLYILQILKVKKCTEDLSVTSSKEPIPSIKKQLSSCQKMAFKANCLASPLTTRTVLNLYQLLYQLQ